MSRGGQLLASGDVHLRRPPSIALLGALLGVLSPSGAHADGERHRWPRWPTEFDQVVAPLRDEAAPGRDHDRVEALLRLDAYATDLVAPWLLLALGDPSSAVKREALRLCFEREVVACVPSALAIGSAVTEPMLRVAALRVVGLDPSGAGLDALLGALRDEGESMRAQAAAVLGSAALHGSGRSRATAALLAKLGDLSAVVRQSAVEALGTIGSTDATLPIARLLEDAGGAALITQFSSENGEEALRRYFARVAATHIATTAYFTDHTDAVAYLETVDESLAHGLAWFDGPRVEAGYTTVFHAR